MAERLRPGAVLALILALAAGCATTGRRRAVVARPRVVAATVPVQRAAPLVVARIRTGLHDTCSMVAAGGRLWVAGFDDILLVIDPGTNRITGRLRLPGWSCRLAVSDGRLWALLPGARLLAAIDPVRRRIVRLARTEDPCTWGLTAGARALWVVDNTGEPAESERDPRTGATLARLPMVTVQAAGEAGPCAVAVARGDVWFGADTGLWRVDPRDRRVSGPFPAGPEPAITELAAGNDLYVGNRDDGQMRRIDTRTGAVRTIYRFGGGSIAVAGPDLWTTSSLETVDRGGTDPILVHVDRTHDRVLARYRIGRRAPQLMQTLLSTLVTAKPPPLDQAALALSAVAVAFGSVWVAQNAEGRIYRLNPRASAAA